MAHRGGQKELLRYFRRKLSLEEAQLGAVPVLSCWNSKIPLGLFSHWRGSGTQFHKLYRAEPLRKPAQKNDLIRGALILGISSFLFFSFPKGRLIFRNTESLEVNKVRLKK